MSDDRDQRQIEVRIRCKKCGEQRWLTKRGMVCPNPQCFSRLEPVGKKELQRLKRLFPHLKVA